MPKKLKKVNISIDDVSPHPKSSIRVLDRCFDLIKDFKNIKFSLFVPISYWRTIKPGIATNLPLQIDLFPDFCKAIKNLPKENFELCYHGFYHGIPKKSDNDEFRYMSYDDAKERFEAMFAVTKKANLEGVFKNIFRPPAWRMTPEAISAAKDKGIEILALSSTDYALETYKGADKKFEKVVYDTCVPPFKPLTLSAKTEVVYHACEWDKNYLDVEKTKQLNEFLSKNLEKIEFCFLDKLT